MEIMIILIACAVAGIICLGLYSSMKPVSRQQSAGQYVTQDRLVMSVNEDTFIRETESRTRIANQAAPGMAAGSAGASPGQNMTISASAPGTPAAGHGGTFIDLTGGTVRPGSGSQTGPTIHLGQQQIHFGQPGHPGQHSQTSQQSQGGAAGNAHKPGYIDLSRGKRSK